MVQKGVINNLKMVINNLKISQQFFFKTHNQAYASGIFLSSININLDHQDSDYLSDLPYNFSSVEVSSGTDTGTVVGTEGLLIMIGITAVCIILGTIAKQRFERRNIKELVNLTFFYVEDRKENVRPMGEILQQVIIRASLGHSLILNQHVGVLADMNDCSGKNLKKLYKNIPNITFRKIRLFPGPLQVRSTRPYIEFPQPVTWVVAYPIVNGRPTLTIIVDSFNTLKEDLINRNVLSYDNFFPNYDMNQRNLEIVTGIDEDTITRGHIQQFPDFIRVCMDLEYMSGNIPYFLDEKKDSDEY